jgi:hypothetical protein
VKLDKKVFVPFVSSFIFAGESYQESLRYGP